jgi:hypothetical protein
MVRNRATATLLHINLNEKDAFTTWLETMVSPTYIHPCSIRHYIFLLQFCPWTPLSTFVYPSLSCSISLYIFTTSLSSVSLFFLVFYFDFSVIFYLSLQIRDFSSIYICTCSVSSSLDTPVSIHTVCVFLSLFYPCPPYQPIFTPVLSLTSLSAYIFLAKKAP